MREELRRTPLTPYHWRGWVQSWLRRPPPRSSADDVDNDAGALRRGEGVCRVDLALQNQGGTKMEASISPSVGGRGVLLLSGEVAPITPY